MGNVCSTGGASIAVPWPVWGHQLWTEVNMCPFYYNGLVIDILLNQNTSLSLFVLFSGTLILIQYLLNYIYHYNLHIHSDVCFQLDSSNVTVLSKYLSITMISSRKINTRVSSRLSFHSLLSKHSWSAFHLPHHPVLVNSFLFKGDFYLGIILEPKKIKLFDQSYSKP